MRRRTWAGLVAVALLVGLSVAAYREPVPYVTFSPGPTVNVLGKYEKKDIISVSGRSFCPSIVRCRCCAVMRFSALL